MLFISPLIPPPLALALGFMAQGASPDVGPLDVTVLHPVEGPEVVVHRLEGPLVALRLSAPVDPELPEGAVELVQELARPAARETAARYGARLTFRHEEGRAVVAVTGPVAAFDALAGVLRAAATDLDLTAPALIGARARAEDRALSRLERPGPRVRRFLWHRLFGGPPPTGAAAMGLSAEEVRRVAGRLYGRERLRVVVVGDVPEPVLRIAFSRWPSGSTGGAVPVSAEGVEPTRPQAHREWAGLGYPVATDPAVAAVAAELLGRRIRTSPLREGDVSVWRGATGWALVITGATEPGDSAVRAVAGEGALPVGGQDPDPAATAVGRYLRQTIAEVGSLADAAAVEAARTALRHRVLLESRTASGRAEVIGRLTDVLGSGGAAGFLSSLEAVELDAVRGLLQELLDTPAIYVEAG